MKWIVIDFGNSEVKAAVRGLGNKPTKLTYNEGISYSYMPSEVLMADEIYIGRQVFLLNAIGAEVLLSNWSDHVQKDKIIKKFLLSIKQAAKDYYSEEDIGAVLIFDDVTEKNIIQKALNNKKNENMPNIANIAKDVFSIVNCVCSSEAIMSTREPNMNLAMVVDFGFSSLKISIVDNGEQISFNRDIELGFKNVDISDIVAFDFEANYSNTEYALYGMYLNEIVRRNLCLNMCNYYLLPRFKNATLGKSEIQKKFDTKMMQYMYKCFDVCGCSLKNLKKDWRNLDSIVFCGGAGNYHLISQTFENYKTSYGIDNNSIKIETFGKDAQWIAAYSAIQLPIERNGSTVTIEY